MLQKFVRNSRGYQCGGNYMTDNLNHQQTERCWTNRNAFYQNNKKKKMDLEDKAGNWTLE